VCVRTYVCTRAYKHVHLHTCVSMRHVCVCAVCLYVCVCCLRVRCRCVCVVCMRVVSMCVMTIVCVCARFMKVVCMFVCESVLCMSVCGTYACVHRSLSARQQSWQVRDRCRHDSCAAPCTRPIDKRVHVHVYVSMCILECGVRGICSHDSCTCTLGVSMRMRVCQRSNGEGALYTVCVPP